MPIFNCILVMLNVLSFLSAKRNSVITLLKTVFSTLTIAMRYEPANAKFFATEVSNT